MEQLRRRLAVGERGVTMMELVVIIAIVGVLASIAVTDMTRFLGKYRARGLTQDTIGLLSYARERAIADGRRTCVWFPTVDSGATEVDQSKVYSAGARIGFDNMLTTSLECAAPTNGQNHDGIFDVWNMSDVSLAVGAPAGLTNRRVQRHKGVSFEPLIWTNDPGATGYPTLVFSPRGHLESPPTTSTGWTGESWLQVVAIRNKDANPLSNRYVVWMDRGGNVQVTNGAAPGPPNYDTPP